MASWQEMHIVHKNQNQKYTTDNVGTIFKNLQYTNLRIPIAYASYLVGASVATYANCIAHNSIARTGREQSGLSL